MLTADALSRATAYLGSIRARSEKDSGSAADGDAACHGPSGLLAGASPDTVWKTVKEAMVVADASSDSTTEEAIAASRLAQYNRCKALLVSHLAPHAQASVPGKTGSAAAALWSVRAVRQQLDTIASFEYASSHVTPEDVIDPARLRNVHTGLPGALFASASISLPSERDEAFPSIASLLDCTLVAHVRLGDVAVEAWARDIGRQAERASDAKSASSAATSSGPRDGSNSLRATSGAQGSDRSAHPSTQWSNVADTYADIVLHGTDEVKFAGLAGAQPIQVGTTTAPPAPTCQQTGPAPASARAIIQFATPWPSFEVPDQAQAGGGSGIFSRMRSSLSSWVPNTKAAAWRDWKIVLTDSAQAVHDFENWHGHSSPSWQTPHVHHRLRVPPFVRSGDSSATSSRTNAERLLQAQYLLDIPEVTCARDLHQALPLSFYTALALGNPVTTVTEAAAVSSSFRASVAGLASLAEDVDVDTIIRAAFPHFTPSTPWLHMHLVTEPNGLSHPLVIALAAATGASVQTSSLSRDMATMLASRSLVLSTSTFSWLAADMGLARTAHYPHHGFFTASPDKHGCLLHPRAPLGGDARSPPVSRKQWVYHDVLRFLVETSAGRDAFNEHLAPAAGRGDGQLPSNVVSEAAMEAVQRRLDDALPMSGANSSAHDIAGVAADQMRQWASFWSYVVGGDQHAPSPSTDHAALQQWMWKPLDSLLEPYASESSAQYMWNAAWSERGEKPFATGWFDLARSKAAAEAGGILSRTPTCASLFHPDWPR